jgi:histone arginine demethylase JMJD6
MCSDEPVPLMRYEELHSGWGHLQSVGQSSVGNYLRTLELGLTDLYLFDISLPMICPELLSKSYVVPKYFANDFLQRFSDRAAGDFQNTWPSYFSGPPGSRVGLHVDAFQSHFWMALLSGRKRWLVVPPNDFPLLYFNLEDHSFPYSLLDFDSRESELLLNFPLLSLVTRYEGLLEAGELIFIPGGSAHEVMNLAPVSAVSMNYISPSNRDRASRHLRFMGGPKAAAELSSPNFDDRICLLEDNIPWAEFKSFPSILRRCLG